MRWAISCASSSCRDSGSTPWASNRLIDGIEFGTLLGDKAFDSNAIIADLNQRGAKAVISQHPRRAIPLQIDTEMYKWRHFIENFFCKLKEFKRIALRADKTDRGFKAIIYLAAAVINSR